MYELVLGIVVIAFLAVTGIRRSRTGRALIAVRDNERGAASYSIPVVRAKLTAFALSGFLAAVAGCLLVHVNRGYDEGPFVAAESLGIFTAAVVGGLGSLAGAVLGALYLNGGKWFLPAPWNQLPSAVGVLLVLMILPGGLGNLLYRGRDALLRRLARKRGIVVSSLLADSAGDEAPEAIKVAMPERPRAWTVRSPTSRWGRPDDRPPCPRAPRPPSPQRPPPEAGATRRGWARSAGTR